MKSIALTAFILLATFASGAGDPSESIRQFIDNKSVHSYYQIDNEYLLSGDALPLFYVNRFYAPAWFNQDAFMLLGSHLYYGKVNPEKEGANWKMQRKDPELRLDLKLEEALATNDVGNELNKLVPRYRSYWMMKEELAFFLELKELSVQVV